MSSRRHARHRWNTGFSERACGWAAMQVLRTLSDATIVFDPLAKSHRVPQYTTKEPIDLIQGWARKHLGTSPPEAPIKGFPPGGSVKAPTFRAAPPTPVAKPALAPALAPAPAPGAPIARANPHSLWRARPESAGSPVAPRPTPASAAEPIDVSTGGSGTSGGAMATLHEEVLKAQTAGAFGESDDVMLASAASHALQGTVPLATAAAVTAAAAAGAACGARVALWLSEEQLRGCYMGSLALLGGRSFVAAAQDLAAILRRRRLKLR